MISVRKCHNLTLQIKIALHLKLKQVSKFCINIENMTNFVNKGPSNKSLALVPTRHTVTQNKCGTDAIFKEHQNVTILIHARKPFLAFHGITVHFSYKLWNPIHAQFLSFLQFYVKLHQIVLVFHSKLQKSEDCHSSSSRFT